MKGPDTKCKYKNENKKKSITEKGNRAAFNQWWQVRSMISFQKNYFYLAAAMSIG